MSIMTMKGAAASAADERTGDDTREGRGRGGNAEVVVVVGVEVVMVEEGSVLAGMGDVEEDEEEEAMLEVVAAVGEDETAELEREESVRFRKKDEKI